MHTYTSVCVYIYIYECMYKYINVCMYTLYIYMYIYGIRRTCPFEFGILQESHVQCCSDPAAACATTWCMRQVPPRPPYLLDLNQS